MAARASKPSTHAQQRAALRKGRARVWQSGVLGQGPPSRRARRGHCHQASCATRCGLSAKAGGPEGVPEAGLSNLPQLSKWPAGPFLPAPCPSPVPRGLPSQTLGSCSRLFHSTFLKKKQGPPQGSSATAKPSPHQTPAPQRLQAAHNVCGLNTVPRGTLSSGLAISYSLRYSQLGFRFCMAPPPPLDSPASE